MTLATLQRETVVPEEDERHLYRKLEDVLQGPAARLIGPRGEETQIPPKLYRLMRTLVHLLATNKAVIVTATNKDLTTQQAADLLGVSRPSLVRLLEEEHAIPFKRIGTHRRISIADLLAYREREYRRQRQAMTELTRIGEALGGYDLGQEMDDMAAHE